MPKNVVFIEKDRRKIMTKEEKEPFNGDASYNTKVSSSLQFSTHICL